MFPKGNLNRVWLVIGAINALEKPTLINISKSIGMPKGSVNDVIKKLLDGQVAGIEVEKLGAEYKIVRWLDLRTEIDKIYTKNHLQVG